MVFLMFILDFFLSLAMERISPYKIMKIVYWPSTSS